MPSIAEEVRAMPARPAPRMDEEIAATEEELVAHYNKLAGAWARGDDLAVSRPFLGPGWSGP